MPPATSTDALVLVDKPAGLTSYDIVRGVQRALGAPKAGHAGTLDPFATGLLVILTGRATRLLGLVPGEPKVYLATIRFGEERDTDDVTGAVTRQAPLPDPAVLHAALGQLTGAVQQVPPAYSAKRVGGRRAYAIARQGGTPGVVAATVRVDRWEILDEAWPCLTVRIQCGAGTYIRALARDLGRLMQSAACLEALRREASGPFAVTEAVSWQEVTEGRLATRPVVEALGGLPRQQLDADDARRVSHGMAVPAHEPGERAALLGAGGELLAVAHRDQERWQPDVVLASA